MQIFYPSFNRHEAVHAFDFLQSGFIVIPESQEDAYKVKYDGNLVTIPDEMDGNITKKRNAVIDVAKKMGIERFYMIDDDIDGCENIWHEIEFTGEQALELLEVQYNLAQEMGIYMWGFQPSSQNFPAQYKPFSMNKMLDQIYGLDITDGIRFDESITLYDNMDLCLQKLNKHRRIWRDDRHHFTEAYSKGGKNSQIRYNDADRLHWQKVMQKKWGSRIIKTNKLNVRANVPIAGV